MYAPNLGVGSCFATLLRHMAVYSSEVSSHPSVQMYCYFTLVLMEETPSLILNYEVSVNS